MRYLVVISLLFVSSVAQAHTGENAGSGFVAGLSHPIFGLDHLLAMLAVGLWGSQAGGRAVFVWPVVFPLIMVAGAVMALAGIGLPFVEPGILASVIVLGLMVAIAVKPPLWVGALIVGALAIFHGHAHGTELPHSANAALYAVGFVLSTGAIHLAGIALGELRRIKTGTTLVRALGGLTALAGVVLAAG